MPSATGFSSTQADAPHVLIAKALTKVYRMGSVDVTALREISVSISPGEFLALSGPSGSGKTTLLNLLGLLDKPSSGEILIDGKSTRKMDSDALSDLRAKKIGYVFQTFNLIPTLTAIENVEYPLLLLNYPRKMRRELAADALGKVGLSAQLNRRPAQLSGGQRQRVAVARAIVKKPALVLADEPTANLDKTNAESIVELMLELNRSEGNTFVFSSHDPTILSRAGRIIHIRDGTERVEGVELQLVSHRHAA